MSARRHRAAEALMNVLEAAVDGLVELRGADRAAALEMLRGAAVSEREAAGIDNNVRPNGNDAKAEVYDALVRAIELSDV